MCDKVGEFHALDNRWSDLEPERVQRELIVVHFDI